MPMMANLCRKVVNTYFQAVQSCYPLCEPVVYAGERRERQHQMRHRIYA